MRIFRWVIYIILLLVSLFLGAYIFAGLFVFAMLIDSRGLSFLYSQQTKSQPFYGQSRRQRNDGYEIYRSTQFFETFGWLCKIDGVVTRDEIQGVETIFKHLRFTDEQVASAREAFRRGKSADFDFELALNQISNLRISPQLATRLIHLMHIVVANTGQGGFVAQEVNLLFRIGRAYGLSFEQLGQILMQPQNDSSHTSSGAHSSYQSTTRINPLDAAFACLEVDKDTSLKETEKKYRKLRGRFHPDRLPKNASESERDQAEKRFDDVQRAWDIVRVHHGV